GTTFVGVLPTHRRRGLLRKMMDGHFADIRARREPLAALWAAEAGIYGRFGYGLASWQNRQVLPRGAVFRGAPPDGEVRLIDPADAVQLLPAHYAAACAATPGMYARSETWWQQRRLYDPAHRRGDASALLFAVHEGRDGVRGYIIYRRTGRPFARDP